MIESLNAIRSLWQRSTICLYAPARRAFVVKSIEEPRTVVREFDSWQQYLAYALLQIAERGTAAVYVLGVGPGRRGRRPDQGKMPRSR